MRRGGLLVSLESYQMPPTPKSRRPQYPHGQTPKDGTSTRPKGGRSYGQVSGEDGQRDRDHGAQERHADPGERKPNKPMVS